ncbi:hypothetical protein XAUB_08650 [Xanthomonas citri pv. aurantifolii str. ICPB 11122]|nr:hypothetical protein XAUB_08650 [Xanthomonas citri pv. aurantifolii str. ICPB 11122]
MRCCCSRSRTARKNANLHLTDPPPLISGCCIGCNGNIAGNPLHGDVSNGRSLRRNCFGSVQSIKELQAFDAFYQFFAGVLAITSGPSPAQRRLSGIWIVGDVVDK